MLVCGHLLPTSSFYVKTQLTTKEDVSFAFLICLFQLVLTFFVRVGTERGHGAATIAGQPRYPGRDRGGSVAARSSEQVDLPSALGNCFCSLCTISLLLADSSSGNRSTVIMGTEVRRSL